MLLLRRELACADDRRFERRGDPGQHVSVAAPEADHGGREGRARLLRLSLPGLRQCRSLRPAHGEADGLARAERASEVEAGRSQLPAEGMGTVRLREEVSRASRHGLHPAAPRR